MATVVNTTTLDIRRSVNTPDFQPPTWEPLTEAEADAAEAIPRQHRKWVDPDVVEMTQPEKDAVDAAAQTAADDAEMQELRSFIYALKKQTRRELNTVRAKVDEILVVVKGRHAAQAGGIAALGDVTPGAFSSAIRARLEEI